MPGTGRSTSTTAIGRTSRTDRPLPGDRRRGARTDVGRRAVLRRSGDVGQPVHRPPPRLRLGARSRAVVGQEYRDLLDRRGAIFGDDTWPTVVLSNHVSPGTPAACPRRPGSTTRTASRAPRRPSSDVRGRRSSTTARRSACATSSPIRRGHRCPPGAWRRAGSGGTATCRSPMPWTAERGHGFTTGRPWIRFKDDADPQCGRPGGRPRLRAGDVPAVDRAASGSGQPAPGALRRLDIGGDDVLAYLREADGEATLVVANFGQAGTTVDLGPPVPVRGGPSAGRRIRPRPDGSGSLELHRLESGHPPAR